MNRTRSPAAVRDAPHLGQRPALRDLRAGVVELPDSHPVHRPGPPERRLGQHGHMSPDHAHEEPGVLALEALGHANVATEGRRARVHDDMVVVSGERSHLLEGQAVGRGVDQPASGHERGGLGQPGGIPEGADLPASLVPGPCPAVEAVERRRMEKQGAERHESIRLGERFGQRPGAPRREARRLPSARTQPAKGDQSESGVGQLSNASDDAHRQAAGRAEPEGGEENHLAPFLRPHLRRHEEEHTIDEHRPRLQRHRRRPIHRGAHPVQDQVDLGRAHRPAKDEASERGRRSPRPQPSERRVEVVTRCRPRRGEEPAKPHTA